MSDTAPTGPTQIPVPSLYDPAASSAQKREAVVYFPGMGTKTDETIEAVAHRIAVALDNTHAQPSTSFVAVPSQAVKYDGGTAKAATIVRRDARGDTPVVDVFEMDYRTVLTGAFESGSPLYKVGQLVGALAHNAGGLIAAIRRRGQGFRQKVQVAYALAVTGLMLAYVVMLVAAGVSTAANAMKLKPIPAPRAEVTTPATPPANGGTALTTGTQGAPGAQIAAPQQPADAAAKGAAPAPRTRTQAFRDGAAWAGKAAWAWLKDSPRLFWNLLLTGSGKLQALVVAMTAAGLLSRRSIKEMVQRSATVAACASHYLAFGEHRNAILGSLARLLDRIGSRDGVVYERIHVVGYSLGSVVAIDAVYQDSEVNAAFRNVATLTTIGCPADFIRTYYHDYFVDRCAPGHAVKWVNVFSPADVLASNFATGSALGRGAARGHRTQDHVRAVAPAVAAGGADTAAARAVLAQAAVRSHELNGAVRLRVVEDAPAPAHLLRLPDTHVHFGPPAPVGMVKWLVFIAKGHGFAAHACYWGAGASFDKSCWEPVVEKLGLSAAAARIAPPRSAATPDAPKPAASDAPKDTPAPTP